MVGLCNHRAIMLIKLLSLEFLGSVGIKKQFITYGLLSAPERHVILSY